MNNPRFFAILIFLFFVLITTTNQQIASSPDILQETIEAPLSQSKKELIEMQGVFHDYEQWLTDEMAVSGTVGAAVAIIYKNQIAFLKCLGIKKVGETDSIDEHTIFRLASVSKPITGVLAGILAQEKVLDLDEKVTETLPWFRLGNPSSTSQLTIRNLLNHTTGLVPHAFDDLVEGHLPFCAIVNRLKHAGISAPPGQIYSYQNVMFSLVDTILSVKTSRNYRQLVTEKLFEPLEMNDASIDFQSFRDNPNKAFPHRGGEGVYRLLPLNDRYYTTAPAAGINASVSDMAQFLLALLDEQDSLLENKIQQTIFSPQVVSPMGNGYFRYWDRVDSKQYGIGWRIVDYKGRQIAYHGGYVSGYKAEIALCKEESIGIVYLTNSPNSLASQSIPVFLNSFFDYKENAPVLAHSEDGIGYEPEESLKKQGS